MMSEEWVDPKADMCTDWFHEVDSDKGIWGSKITKEITDVICEWSLARPDELVRGPIGPFVLSLPS